MKSEKKKLIYFLKQHKLFPYKSEQEGKV